MGSSISVNGREALPLDHPAVTMAALTKCTDAISGRPSLRPEIPLATATTQASGGPISLIASKGGFMVDGVVNGSTPVRFHLDTGASYVTLPSGLVYRLMQEGALTPVANANFVLANGSKVRGSVYVLRSLSVGGYVAYNVLCSEMPDGSDPLLGQSFLGKFRSISIDTVNKTLSLG